MRSFIHITYLFSMVLGAPYSHVNFGNPYTQHSYSTGSHPKAGNWSSKFNIYLSEPSAQRFFWVQLYFTKKKAGFEEAMRYFFKKNWVCFQAFLSQNC